MKKIFFFLVIVICFCFAKTDSEIKQEMIKKSIASYSGSCAYPYNYAKKGTCGKRSAYSKSRSVLCYESDITDEMLQSYKKRME
ncbi:MAG: hypothetical protein LBP40_04045 [Campylobacteraceae bacterium]|jgi:hypothetical protein|nr:hypothetical protein [Campylobacteraceae bacterium]